ncbi:protein phosphatase 1 regulatory subunit 12A isoform X3 [Zootermopsis nevadensis]|uniref:protein phosphatase 1 regulatory subunit 12A isoform X3 n=1 Tax=Zootermopsis nevadensis TaxID=136037 RepID=UPI000B8E42AF|nr:protein phosphatase 1 regulatory subunit 12A isoform X3 [Zootermopsis nevadensis]
MSNEIRSNSALFKRAEQLKRWEESETNRVAAVPNSKSRKIQFSAGCVFLAACAAGDKEEVLRLIAMGADIDTANVDGLTALHQACIDDNLEMVEFLVENGADVNRGDNEGWTPLHATASCGFISIAKYLIEHGANVAAVNNDAELPLDIAESDEMEDMLQQNINAQGIDCDEARNEEERMMLEDAKEWLNSGDIEDMPHPKTGATALHVAAAKGYIKVMSVLLQGGANVNSQDFDGWTPLHAAAHWGQKEACEMLVEEFCDMDMKNYVGQTAYDVADTDMFRLLEELKKKQATAQKDHGDINAILQKKGASTPKRRSSIIRMSVTDKSNLINKDTSSERQLLDRSITEESSNKVKKVELEIETESEKEDASIPSPENEVENQETASDSSESTDDSETSSDSDTVSSGNEEEKKNRANRDEPSRIPIVPDASKTVPNATPNSPPKTQSENDDTTLPAWKHGGSFRSRGTDGRLEQPPNKSLYLRIGEKDNSSHKATTPVGADSRNIVDTPEVVLRRTQSFEADEKFYRRYMELQARIKAGSCPTLHSSPVSALPTRSASLREKHLPRRGSKDEVKFSSHCSQEVPTTTATTTITTVTATTAGTVTTTVTSSPAKTTATSPTATSPVPTSLIRSPAMGSVSSASPSTPSTPTTPGGSKLSPGNIFKNFFKSFVPPVRDEESETQRKAHAKRVRETRRSTQGVTLEEIKVAEQLVKKKNQQQLHQATQQLSNNEQPPVVISTASSTSITATITTATPTVPSSGIATKEEGSVQERRPSWRLRVDNGDRSKFMLEDARNRNSVSESTAPYVRRLTGSSNTTVRPSSAPVESNTADATLTIPLRRQTKPPDDKEQDKENDVRNAQATQAVIQRRRRPKRRSTGVVHIDMDDINPDRQESPVRDGDELMKANNDESGGDLSSHSLRLSRVSSLAGDDIQVNLAKDGSENGEVDYKKLYEESMAENERLREKLKKTEEDLNERKCQLDKLSVATAKNSLTELEKRERRGMERKLSEMEEELKLLEQFKSENQRLKDENGALIRVISKLSK